VHFNRTLRISRNQIKVVTWRGDLFPAAVGGSFGEGSPLAASLAARSRFSYDKRKNERIARRQVASTDSKGGGTQV